MENLTKSYESSLWEVLRGESRPVFLYGTGNGGDKIIAACERYDIHLTGVFASDGFVRSRTFHEMPVRSYSDVVTEYGENIVVLLAFGTVLPEVRAFIEQLDQRHDLYIPDVPLYGGELFDGAYFAAHSHQLAAVRTLLGDEKSVAIFDDCVNFRLSGRYRYLLSGQDNPASLREVFGDIPVRTVLDGGTFKGDSAAEFIEVFSPKKILAVEADGRTCGKLSDYAETTGGVVVPVNAALWDSVGEVRYVSSASRGSGEAGRNRRAKEVTVCCRTIEDILTEHLPEGGIDLIKLDVEGAEALALTGGEAVLLRERPNLAVSLYHRTDDLWELPERVHALLPEHRLYLRRADCIPFWDLTLYAVR